MNIQERNRPQVLDRIATTAGQLSDTVAQASEELQEGIDNIERRFTEVRDSVTDKTKEYSRTLNSYVTKNPWAAIGISAGLAFVAGILIGRRP